jgi:hypothetical protein
MTTRPLNTLLFGGCLVHWPMTRTSRAEGRLAYDAYGPIREVHSFGEMFQIVEILRGQRTITPELHLLTRMVELVPMPGASDFSDIDVVLLEPASPIELSFRGVAFNRSKLNLLLKPIVEKGKEERRAGASWIRYGLVGLNEEIRAETAARLVQSVGGDSPEDELTRAIFLETRAEKTDVLGGFVKMQELIKRPTGVVSYVFRYMPDGRAISWPAGFREEVLAAAEHLNLPVFDPVPLVQKFGVQAALQADLGHYNDNFMPVAADALVEFAEAVYRNAAGEAVAAA